MALRFIKNKSAKSSLLEGVSALVVNSLGVVPGTWYSRRVVHWNTSLKLLRNTPAVCPGLVNCKIQDKHKAPKTDPKTHEAFLFVLVGLRGGILP